MAAAVGSEDIDAGVADRAVGIEADRNAALAVGIYRVGIEVLLGEEAGSSAGRVAVVVGPWPAVVAAGGGCSNSDDDILPAAGDGRQDAAVAEDCGEAKEEGPDHHHRYRRPSPAEMLDRPRCYDPPCRSRR